MLYQCHTLPTDLAHTEGEYDGEQLDGGDADNGADDNVEILLDVVGELVEAAL